MSENTTYSDSIIDSQLSDDESLSLNATASREKKKRPLKTDKMPLKEAVKTAQERSYYVIIDKFFKNCDEKIIEKMINIISKKKNDDSLSLRMLTWFASQQNESLCPIEIEIETEDGGKTELFDIKISYKAQLDTFSKKYFDPFRRGKRFDYCYDKNNSEKCIETTLCQLNFFKWLFTYDLLTYVEKNYDILKGKMRNFQTEIKQYKVIKKDRIKEKKIINKKQTEYEKKNIKEFIENDFNKLIITF